MLRWEHTDNKYTGYNDEDEALYIVEPDCDNPEQWQWVTVDPDGYGTYSFDTAQEAMDDAEEDYASVVTNTETPEEVTYTHEEIEEIMGDRLYEARRDDSEYF